MKGNEPVLRVQFKGRLGRFELDVKFHAPMHGITALLGPSGCGKTTVLRCVAGLNRIPGVLSIGDEVWQDLSGAFLPPHSRSIGYIFQEPSLFPHLSVRKNLLYGNDRAVKAGLSGGIRLSDVVDLMGISNLLDRGTSDLSGGERQRVAIGRALLAQPQLLLMDEPLSALDRNTKEEILPYFETLHEKLSVPILYVTHDISEVERLADMLVLLEEGRVVAAGPLTELLSDSHLPIAARPDAAAIVDARITGYDSHYSLTEMVVDGESLLVPGNVGEAGNHRRVRIAAADVSLAPGRPSQTSILNILSVRVYDIVGLGDAQVTVVVTLGHREGGSKVLARISRRALETIKLAVGQDIYAQVKAVSLIT